MRTRQNVPLSQALGRVRLWFVNEGTRRPSPGPFSLWSGRALVAVARLPISVSRREIPPQELEAKLTEPLIPSDVSETTIAIPAEWATQKAMWTAWPADAREWNGDLEA